MQQDIAQRDAERKGWKKKYFHSKMLPQIVPGSLLHGSATCPPAGLPFQIKSCNSWAINVFCLPTPSLGHQRKRPLLNLF
jgi:hypothetical protein